MTPLADYQIRVTASEIRPGDFVDHIDPNTTLRGPRGGRYRYDGARVQSRVERVTWVMADGSEIGTDTTEHGWRPLRLNGFRIYTRAGRTTLPGNLADLTTAVIRRKDS
jgi:hypothetical protein